MKTDTNQLKRSENLRERNRRFVFIAFGIVTTCLMLTITSCSTDQSSASGQEGKKTDQKIITGKTDNERDDTDLNKIDPSDQDQSENGTSDRNTSDTGDRNETKPSADYSNKSSSSQIRLAIPQRIQENGYYCGPASLQMVLDYHDISVSQDQLAADLNTSSITGTEYEDLARVANQYIFGKDPQSNTDPGYRAVILPAWASDHSQKVDFERRALMDLTTGDPVFVSINNEVAYGPGYGTIHQVVLYGVDIEDGKAVNYYFRDPSYTQQDTENEGKKVVSADELWKIMTQNPEPGYVW
ncbi:C39 family peptidase [Ileibacterium valens]|uniref:C39 family peptidase n=1 Tax=Ileibacterium valens TaxID=1862668 RepID=UPI003F737DE7